MSEADRQLATIRKWLQQMTVHRSEDAEDAVAELRACVACLNGEEAQALLPVLSRTAELATHAYSLWAQVTADTGGPAYTPQH